MTVQQLIDALSAVSNKDASIFFNFSYDGDSIDLDPTTVRLVIPVDGSASNCVALEVW